MEEVLVLFRVPAGPRVPRIISVGLVLVDAGPRAVFAQGDGHGRMGAVEPIGPATEVTGDPIVPAIVLVEADEVGQVIKRCLVPQVRGCRRRSRRVLLMSDL